MLLFATLALADTGCPATWPEPTAPNGRAILVLKSERRLAVYENGTLAARTLTDGSTEPACFAVGLGQGGIPGPKRQRGDLKTPEGHYRVFKKNPNSRYYKSLGVSYPNADDVRASQALGVVTTTTAQTALATIASGKTPSQYTEMGGDIMIHGFGGTSDWTLGCIAVENVEMDYLFAVGEPGTPVLILPSLTGR